MKKYTYEDWLKGKIEARKKDFSFFEWTKVRAKQKELYDEAVENKFIELKNGFFETYEASSNMANYLDTFIEDINQLFNPSLKIGEQLSSDEKELRQHCMYIGKDVRPDYSVIKYPNFSFLDEYHHYINAEAYNKLLIFLYSLKKQNPQNEGNEFIKCTTKQQLLIIHYLDKYGILCLKKIHQDGTKQAKLLSSLLNRNEANIYTCLIEIHKEKYKKTYFTRENLQLILPLFKKLGISQIQKDIELEINSLG
jgi:hypothetical protein